jgi:hypothetical protein
MSQATNTDALDLAAEVVNAANAAVNAAFESEATALAALHVFATKALEAHKAHAALVAEDAVWNIAEAAEAAADEAKNAVWDACTRFINARTGSLDARAAEDEAITDWETEDEDANGAANVAIHAEIDASLADRRAKKAAK